VLIIRLLFFIIFVHERHQWWWPMGGWAIGLIFHYMFEYRNPKFLSEEEFNKLKRKDLQS
jgi:hypothetical protein